MSKCENREFNQQKHPEIRKGEMWLANDFTYSSEKRRMPVFKTARFGLVAYKKDGTALNDCNAPIFVEIKEYMSKTIDVKKERKTPAKKKAVKKSTTKKKAAKKGGK